VVRGWGVRGKGEGEGEWAIAGVEAIRSRLRRLRGAVNPGTWCLEDGCWVEWGVG
jgi:hypothetical protein